MVVVLFIVRWDRKEEDVGSEFSFGDIELELFKLVGWGYERREGEDLFCFIALKSFEK